MSKPFFFSLFSRTSSFGLPFFTLTCFIIITRAASTPSSQPSLPQPFDSTLNYNLTSSCLSFFNNFLKDQEFQDCRAFSFILMNSNNFAVISRNVEKVPPYLDQICSPPNNLNQCNEIMSSYGAKMTEGSNCRVDIQNQNPIATEAYVAFYTYQLYQDVGCAKNSSNTYCYVDALDRKLGLGIYYLPSGTQLASPKDQFPCSECNKKILNTFSEYAGDTALPLSDTFEPVRNYFNSYCGEDFIKKASAIHVSKLATSSASSLYSRLRKRSIDFPTITRIVLMITIPLFLLDIRL